MRKLLLVMCLLFVIPFSFADTVEEIDAEDLIIMGDQNPYYFMSNEYTVFECYSENECPKVLYKGYYYAIKDNVNLAKVNLKTGESSIIFESSEYGHINDLKIIDNRLVMTFKVTTKESYAFVYVDLDSGDMGVYKVALDMAIGLNNDSLFLINDEKVFIYDFDKKSKKLLWKLSESIDGYKHFIMKNGIIETSEESAFYYNVKEDTKFDLSDKGIDVQALNQDVAMYKDANHDLYYFNVNMMLNKKIIDDCRAIVRFAPNDASYQAVVDEAATKMVRDRSHNITLNLFNEEKYDYYLQDGDALNFLFSDTQANNVRYAPMNNKGVLTINDQNEHYWYDFSKKTYTLLTSKGYSSLDHDKCIIVEDEVIYLSLSDGIYTVDDKGLTCIISGQVYFPILMNDSIYYFDKKDMRSLFKYDIKKQKSERYFTVTNLGWIYYLNSDDDYAYFNINNVLHRIDKSNKLEEVMPLEDVYFYSLYCDNGYLAAFGLELSRIIDTKEQKTYAYDLFNPLYHVRNDKAYIEDDQNDVYAILNLVNGDMQTIKKSQYLKEMSLYEKAIVSIDDGDNRYAVQWDENKEQFNLLSDMNANFVGEHNNKFLMTKRHVPKVQTVSFDFNGELLLTTNNKLEDVSIDEKDLVATRYCLENGYFELEQVKEGLVIFNENGQLTLDQAYDLLTIPFGLNSFDVNYEVGNKILELEYSYLNEAIFLKNHVGIDLRSTTLDNPISAGDFAIAMANSMGSASLDLTVSLAYLLEHQIISQEDYDTFDSDVAMDLGTACQMIYKYETKD